MIHGKISNKQRENILSEFRSESGMNILLMTKVGDISIDIPNANVIIQVSSHFGSRMQEAQRFGRILRAKKDILSEYNAFFYTIVSKNTEEMKYSTKRHRFLVDQGYYFTIMNDKKIIEESIQDSNYKEYVKDTLDKINIKYNHKEKIEEDFSDSKDSFAILNELEKDREDTTISTNIF